MTDCLNGTLITYNGKEFTLQNDFGNGIVESAKLKEGFIPIGLKEYGGIVYIVSHNPLTNESEFGSFPSPERNITPSDYGQAFHSSGLGFVDISQNDFISSGEVSEASIKRDLMKPKDFQLNPGDKFAIYFTNESNYNDLLTKLTSGASRKYYKLKVAKVSDDGIVFLSDFNIYKESDIAFDTDNVKYDVYKENSIGTLAIVMELETIDSFDFLINEKFVSADPNNKIAIIKANAKCSSLVKFKGFKLTITEVASKSIIYNKYLYYNKNTEDYNNVLMEFELSGFEPEKEYSFEAIPFSQFNLYNKGTLRQFIKVKNFVFGKKYATGSEKYDSSLFKYYINDSTLKINFNFSVSTPGFIDGCYLELYDVWSNVSTLYRVNDYINGLDSYVSLPLIDNNLSSELTSNNICGIPSSNLQTFAEFASSDQRLLQCIPTLSINSNTTQGDKLISRNDSLRKNHAYIVKISVIEKYTDANNVEITKYNDIYRYMYTTGIFNDNYFDTDIKNMSLSSYNNIDVTYDLIDSSKTESQTSLPSVYEGNHTLFNNVKYPYKIKLQSDSSPSEVLNFKTTIETKKEVGINSKYELNKNIISKLFGIVNYNAINNVSLINGTSSVLEAISYIGNNSLSSNLNTNSSSVVSGNNIFVDSDNNINVNFNIINSTSRVFFGKAEYNLNNLKTINTNTWVSLYDKLHNTTRNNKVLVEFGIHKVYHSTSTSNEPRIGMKIDGYTAAQTTTKKQWEDTVGNAITSNPVATAVYYSGRSGPDGDIIKDFLTTNGVNCSGFVGKFVGNKYYALDTALGDRVGENEFVFMIRHFKDDYSEYAICPTPFLPEKNQFIYDNLFSIIKDVCSNIVYVTKGNVTYVIFAPSQNDICYHAQFQTIFKTINQKISYTVNNEACSKMVFLSSGNNSLVNYESSLIKNYINQRALDTISKSTATIIFDCHERSNNDFTSGISNLIAPKFIGATKTIDIKVDDITISPELNTFEQNVYQEAKSYALQDTTLTEVTTFPETGRLISEGVTSKKDEYVKYAELFEWKDSFFNYKADSAAGYLSDGTGDRFERKAPDLLVDFAK